MAALLRYGLTSSSREGFAVPPTTIMREALGIGLGSDQRISSWVRNGIRSGTHFDVTTPDQRQLPPAQRQQLAEYFQAAGRSDSKPIVTFNATSRTIEDGKQANSQGEMRAFQVQEMARFYGIPLPLLSVDIRQWGAAVNEQIAKLAYRWGVKLHLDRVLTAIALRVLRPGEHFEIDPMELVKGDYQGMKDFLMALQGDAQREPIATKAELRKIAGLAREPDGAYAEPMNPKPNAGALSRSGMTLKPAVRNVLGHFGVHASALDRWTPELQSSDDSSEILIYGPIVPDRELAWMREWMGDESAVSGKSFREELKAVEGDVTIRINSPGGDAWEGSTMVQAINERSGMVRCMVDGLAGSAASLVMAACTDITMAKLSNVMIHGASSWNYGTADDFRKVADLLEKINEQAASLYLERMTDLSADDVLALMTEETWYTAEEAVEVGLADRVYQKDDKDPDMNARRIIEQRERRFQAVMAAI